MADRLTSAPRLRLLLPALLVLAVDVIVVPWLAPIHAQVVEGVDVGAARARAKAQSHDLEAFSAEVGKRGEALRQEALDMRTGAQANRARIGSVKTGGAKGVFDFDAMIAGADAAATGSKLERPKLIVFASLSMPVPSLKTLCRDVTKAGGVVVFRGFKNGSVKDFMTGLAPAFDKGQKIDGVGIDPRLFRAFDVQAVPTYVVTAGDVEPCDGFHCTTTLPAYDRVAGNVTTDYALSTIAGGRGPGSAAAKVYLTRLRRGGQG
ncbi:type-F conjugative transfer system pilin assembly protein TrbC (plasmid) [Polymorphobacter sp. PAMC 29334]|uniref:type-F conjugative transfer system pilin assembly protein TrbC n=1 Tax=Polymorphobacter sp. PAMC 29334 TaxID=2862331 RepID=UPI001C7686AB|nr:type-F conjugative transfer system pilin assembly protein TrbC [Polymorphobacter sp. PAMC 29334]QYE33142.1 type-F conjugative transfer system pilin assembly protein TrbC [Polymorphobacter sp. PAMC 29334]